MATEKNPTIPPIDPTAPVAVPTPAALPSNIPVAEPAPEITGASVEFTRPEITEYKGLYVNQIDGETYALAIKEGAPDNKTHFLLNSQHSDNCTKEEFKQRYEKSDKK